MGISGYDPCDERDSLARTGADPESQILQAWLEDVTEVACFSPIVIKYPHLPKRCDVAGGKPRKLELG